jgi:hypothetical protein
MMPVLCLLVATAVISGVSLLRRYEIPRAPRTALIAALTVAALLPPALQSISYARSIGRVSTVRQARDWVLDNVPRGTSVVIETRALLLDPQHYRVINVPSLISDPRNRQPREYTDYVNQNVEYVVASSQAYGPVLAAPQRFPDDYARYMRIFEQSREVARLSPSNEHPGPELRILKIKN